MKHLVLAILLCLCGVAMVEAQDWKAGSEGIEYNCETLAVVHESIASGKIADAKGKPFARSQGLELDLYEYIGLFVLTSFVPDENASVTLTKDTLLSLADQACNAQSTSTSTSSQPSADSFNVIANSNGNIRSCAGTNCSVVRKVKFGELLTVIGEEGDWYQIEDENGPAYIATFLVTRGPDTVIDVDELFVDPRTECRVAFDIKRGDENLVFAIAGERQSDVTVDLYRPNNTIPLEVQAQLNKNFTDTGEPYIYQYYSWNTRWPLGTYQLEITLDGKTSLLAWEMKEAGDYTVFVLCD
jgi:hypothetical protein